MAITVTRYPKIPVLFLLLDLNPELAAHDRSALNKKKSQGVLGCVFNLQSFKLYENFRLLTPLDLEQFSRDHYDFNSQALLSGTIYFILKISTTHDI